MFGDALQLQHYLSAMDRFSSCKRRQCGHTDETSCPKTFTQGLYREQYDKLIDLIWHMAFDEEGRYSMGELKNPEELDSYDEMVMKCYEADKAEEEAFFAKVNAKERDDEGK